MSNVNSNVTNHSNDIMASVAHSLMNGIKPDNRIHRLKWM